MERGEGGEGEGKGKKREKMEEGKERETLSLSIIINCQLLTQNIALPSPFHWSVSLELSLTESEIKITSSILLASLASLVSDTPRMPFLGVWLCLVTTAG